MKLPSAAPQVKRHKSTPRAVRFPPGTKARRAARGLVWAGLRSPAELAASVVTQRRNQESTEAFYARRRARNAADQAAQ